jgi:cytochrome c-type biogenesis protein CcmH/NrfG
MILWVTLAFVTGMVAGSAVAILKGKKDLEHPPVASTVPSPLALAPPSIEDTEKIEGLKEELRQNPDDHRSWLRLGNLYANNGQIPLAIDAFRHYLALKPGDVKVWRKLGNLLTRSGDVEGAAEAFKKAAEDDPRGRERP